MGERMRIFNRELIEHGVWVDAPQTLNQVRIRCRTSESGPVNKVGRLDNEGVAIPFATRVTQPLTDLGPDVCAAIDRYEAVFVEHLVEDGDPSLSLQDVVHLLNLI